MAFYQASTSIRELCLTILWELLLEDRVFFSGSPDAFVLLLPCFHPYLLQKGSPILLYGQLLWRSLLHISPCISQVPCSDSSSASDNSFFDFSHIIYRQNLFSKKYKL